MMIIDHIKTCLFAVFSLVNCVLSNSLFITLIYSEFFTCEEHWFFAHT